MKRSFIHPLIKILKNAVILPAILVLLVIQPACRKQADGNYFRTYIQSDPGKLDPFYCTDVVSGRILALMCNGLFRTGTDGKLLNDIVADYTFDGRVLDARLKGNVRFHNGDKVLPEDVIFSIERIRKSEKPTSPRRWIFSNIKKIMSPGKNKIRIELSAASSTFLYLLTTPNCYIISEKDCKESGKITGTGPFEITEWARDDRIVLKKNNGYFCGESAVEGVIFKVIPEDLTARFEFLNDGLDYFELPYLAGANLEKEGITYMDIPELSVHYVALNTKREPFNNKQFRKALNMAIDKKAVMKSLFRDRFKPAAGPVPPEMGGYMSRARAIEYNPEKAAVVLSSFNLSDREFTLIIKADHQVALISQLLQYYLQKAGLRIKIRQMGWAALKSAALRGDFDMAYFTWHADYPEAENFLSPLFYSKNSGAGGNRSFFLNNEADRLILTAGAVIDSRKRYKIYNEIERIIIDEAPWIFLWYGDKRIALSGRVKTYLPYPIYNGMKGNEILLK
ncbi:MAG: ABC transporter substrate-binding protein [Spirochaetes bacterium]|jgi:ABC-type transport system substrate-binding protein|nr:ABC transporter substrate-binding protein [Spirochaetota bacterium]